MNKPVKPWQNASGANDPTAYEAMKRIEAEEKTVKKVIFLMKAVADLAGFDVIGRIQIRNRKTGRLWK